MLYYVCDIAENKHGVCFDRMRTKIIVPRHVLGFEIVLFLLLHQSIGFIMHMPTRHPTS